MYTKFLCTIHPLRFYRSNHNKDNGTSTGTTKPSNAKVSNSISNNVRMHAPTTYTTSSKINTIPSCLTLKSRQQSVKIKVSNNTVKIDSNQASLAQNSNIKQNYTRSNSKPTTNENNNSNAEDIVWILWDDGNGNAGFWYICKVIAWKRGKRKSGVGLARVPSELKEIGGDNCDQSRILMTNNFIHAWKV